MKINKKRKKVIKSIMDAKEATSALRKCLSDINIILDDNINNKRKKENKWKTTKDTL